jgi:hypothetical protein
MINHNPNNVKPETWAKLDNNSENVVWVISMTPNRLISTISKHPLSHFSKTCDVMTDRLNPLSPLMAAFQS